MVLLSNIEDLSVGKRRIEGFEEALKANDLKGHVLRLSGDTDIRRVFRSS
jgi:hypothetical protein